jgi:hypothetical protein
LIAIHNPLSCHMSANLLSAQSWSGLEAGLAVLRQVVELDASLSDSADAADLVVDVGANLGTYSLFAAALGLRVVAFEPLQARTFLL